MIGAFVALLSLNLSLALVEDYGVIYATLPITNATTTTPIVVTSTAHQVPLGRLIHGVVSQVGGTVEANGLWVLTPLDADTFALSTFDAQGNVVNSVGVHAYTTGGQIQWALPDGQILLGRRNKMLATAVATPRIVMIPTNGRAWTIAPYGGADNATPIRGHAEREAQATLPTLGTQFLTFEVFVNGCAPDFEHGSPPSPDFADFDATQALSHALVWQLFDMLGTVSILRESWPSQTERQGAMTQRGQQWCGLLEVELPVYKPALGFVPIGTSLEIVVEPADPLVPDDLTTIEIA